MSLSFDFRGIDRDQIGRLLQMLAESDVEECEVEQGESRVLVRRLAQAEDQASARAPSRSEAAEQPGDGQVTIRAGAVGIFYRSEKRSTPPKAGAGSKVKPGDVLAYIEVMRIPHSVLSTHEGTIEGFLVEDGEAVDYGQPLISLQVSPTDR